MKETIVAVAANIIVIARTTKLTIIEGGKTTVIEHAEVRLAIRFMAVCRERNFLAEPEMINITPARSPMLDLIAKLEQATKDFERMPIFQGKSEAYKNGWADMLGMAKEVVEGYGDER